MEFGLARGSARGRRGACIKARKKPQQGLFSTYNRAIAPREKHVAYLKGLLTIVLVLGFFSSALADVRKSNITDKPGKPGNLSLGCVPKQRKFVVYIRPETGKPPFEDQDEIRRFPAGFSAVPEEEGN